MHAHEKIYVVAGTNEEPPAAGSIPNPPDNKRNKRQEFPLISRDIKYKIIFE